jgi:hypothetical protein
MASNWSMCRGIDVPEVWRYPLAVLCSLVASCFVVSCLVLSYVVLSCLVLFVLSCVVLPCYFGLVLSCLHLHGLVLAPC